MRIMGGKLSGGPKVTHHMSKAGFPCMVTKEHGYLREVI